MSRTVVTSSRTITSSDVGELLRVTGASPVVLDIPNSSGVAIGKRIEIVNQLTSGSLTIVWGNGSTINGDVSGGGKTITLGAYEHLTLMVIDSDSWIAWVSSATLTGS